MACKILQGLTSDSSFPFIARQPPFPPFLNNMVPSEFFRNFPRIAEHYLSLPSSSPLSLSRLRSRFSCARPQEQSPESCVSDEIRSLRRGEREQPSLRSLFLSLDLNERRKRSDGGEKRDRREQLSGQRSLSPPTSTNMREG